jgi:hypothetical protein
VIVELFTSRAVGAPADLLLSHLQQAQPVAGAQVISLSEHVDYWNQLGWTDPFSSAGFSERQRQYAGVFRADGVYAANGSGRQDTARWERQPEGAAGHRRGG